MPLSFGFAKGTGSLNTDKLWSPLQLSPAVWLDATDTDTVVLTSGAVSQWSDKSGNNRHATQSTAANRPTVVNRYNLLTYSEQFNNAIWDRYGVTVSADATTAPNGTTTADRIIESAASGDHGINYTASGVAVVSGTSYIFSVYLKPNGRTVVEIFGDAQNGYLNTSFAKVNISDGTIISLGSATSVTAESVGNGWYRVIMTATATGSTASPGIYMTDGTNQRYVGDGSSGVFAWGAQLVMANVFPSNTYQPIGAVGSHETGGRFPPYLLFDGVDDALNVANWGNVNQPFTRVVVFSPVVMGGAVHKFVLESLAPTANTDIGELLVAGQNTITSGENPYTPCFRNNTYIRVSATNGASSVAHTDGTASATYTRAANQYQTGYAIGWDGVGNNSWANVRIWEVLLIPRVLNDTERQRLEGYLANKYGLKSNLPSNHPYKTSRPSIDFYPGVLTGLATWYDASAFGGVLNDSSAVITTNDTKVRTFVDRSGSGINGVQTNTAKQPTYKTAANGINGLPALYFNNSAITSQANLSLSLFTIFIVFKLTGNGLIYEHGPAAYIGGGCYLHGSTGATIDANRNSLPSEKDYSGNWALGNIARYTCHRFNGTHASHVLKVNGSAASLTNFAVNDPGSSTYTNVFNLGSRNNGASLMVTGLIGEVIIYNRYLSDDEVLQVEKYLQGKWAIS